MAALANGGVPGALPGTAVLRDGELRPGRRPAGDALHRPARAALAGRVGAPPPPPPPPLRPRRPRRPAPRSRPRAAAPITARFCAKIDFRDKYRRRDLAPLLAEIDGLIAQGVEYVYFIDEIFLPNRPLLEALVDAPASSSASRRGSTSGSPT